MACLSHDWEHRQKNLTTPIYEGNSTGRIPICHKAQIHLRELEVQYRLPVVPLIYKIVAGTAENSQ